MATVLHIFRAPKRRPPMEDLAEATAVHEFGLEGCAHARSGSKRQLLLMDSETVDAMDLRPGNLRENITTSGLNVNGLKLGQRPQLVRAQLEVSAACTPVIRWRRSGPACAKNSGAAAVCSAGESRLAQSVAAIVSTCRRTS